MLRSFLILAGLLGLTAIGGAGISSSTVEPTHYGSICPGKITCPQTGEETCADACPKNGGRPDCPGKIVCPIDGSLVCADRCPLDGAGETAQVSAPPSCCDD